MGKPHVPGVSPRSGVAPPEETRFGGPRANPGNPGGKPAGFVRLSQAYAILAEFAPSEVQLIAEGKKPKRWGKRPLYMPYVKAARMWLGIENVPSSVEIADRTEGKVKSTLELEGNSLAGLVAALAKGASK